MYITNVNSCVITVLSLESVSISGDGRIFQTYGDSGVEYSYDFYLKDHLGSTRMVINSQDQITEAVAYQAYGAMIPLDNIANAPEIPAREKFTGKEFDQEGEDSANGVVGIQAYHFGARVYDPEVGVWLAVDPYEQDWNPYGYCGGNPVVFIDPDGNLWNTAGFIIGAAVGGTIGGIAAYNATDGNVGATIAGILVGGVWGGALGSMAGSGIQNLAASEVMRGAQTVALEGIKNVPWDILSKAGLQSLMQVAQLLQNEAFNPSWEWVKNNPHFQQYNAYEPSAYYYYNAKTGQYKLGEFLEPVFAGDDPAGSFDVRSKPGSVGEGWELKGVAHYHWGTHASQEIMNQKGWSHMVTQADVDLLNRLITRNKYLPQGSSVMAVGKRYISVYNSGNNILSWLTRLF